MMIFNKNKENSIDKNEKKKTVNSLKLGMMGSLLSKNKPSETPETQFQKEVIEKIGVDDDAKTIDNSDSVGVLTKIIQKSSEKMIVPKIDFTNGQITYPILQEINKDENDIEFLENLTSDSSGVLEKTVYERIIVCPKHLDSLSINVRLYCPKCHSMSIDKLHLLEHTKCGYIAERNNFQLSKENIVEKCPSCKKSITDMKKEIRIPAMWYTCNDCEEKFDDVLIKLHCRDFNHDFDTNIAQSIEVTGFRLKDSTNNSDFDIASLMEKLTILLNKKGFEAEENHSAKGKSNHYHHIDLYGFNKEGKSIFIFVKKSNQVIDNSEINSKIIQVLDTSPDIAILVGFADMSEKAKSIASSYNISIVSSQDPNGIVSSVEEVLDNQIEKIN